MTESTKKQRMYDDGVRPLYEVCTSLRVKSMYYSETERPGLLHDSDVLTYWCEHTQRETGCDGKFANPEGCQAGRKCFEK